MSDNGIIPIVKDSLWLVSHGKVFLLCDSVCGEVMIDTNEIMPLIEALQAIVKEVGGSDHVS